MIQFDKNNVDRRQLKIELDTIHAKEQLGLPLTDYEVQVLTFEASLKGGKHDTRRPT